MKYGRIFMFLVPFFLTIGCIQPEAKSGVKCNYEQTLPVVTSSTELGAIFLFGERHGTKEAPSFVANFACKIAQDTEETVIVLMELGIPDSLSNLSIDAIPVLEAQSLIIREDERHWTELHDGRTSVAMMDSISRLLALREQGLNIAIGTIYPDTDILSKYGNIDISFADEQTVVNRFFLESLQILRHKEKFKNVVVLSGKNHTRNHLEFFEKMGVDYPHLGFVLDSGGGSEWNCRSHGKGCKTHPAPTARRPLINSSENASLVIFDDANEIFDGAFVFKRTTASAPFLDK
ncbi:hypothetical protein [Litorimonas sp. WD9-15]|uniref:hypothetical protein n=1 Tax=Litorimonas sp. WD9-15 TaxID=3418716 RepID=UPI003D0727AD